MELQEIKYFTVSDRGDDGRAPEQILFASESEKERDRWYESRNDKAYLFKGHQSVSMRSIVDKLNGAEKAFLEKIFKPLLELKPAKQMPR